MHLPKAGGTTLHSIIYKQYPALYTPEWKNQKSIADSEVFEKGLIESLDPIYYWGHVGFGIHHYLPSPFSYYSMMRHPVDRVISAYTFYIQNKWHYRNQIIADLKLEEFVRTLSDPAYPPKHNGLEMDNAQSRLIAGIEGPEMNPIFPFPNNGLELAKKPLTTFR